MQNKGKLVLIVGISGAGKNTVMNGLSDKLVRESRSVSTVVSTTTRPPRKEEIDGEDYFFRTIDEFQNMLREGKFAEHASVHSHYYGTEMDEITRPLAVSDYVLHDIDIEGLLQILRFFPDATTVLIEISPEKLMGRLRDRGDSDADILKRTLTAQRELSAFKSFPFDIRISNDGNNPADAVNTLFSALVAQQS